MLLVVLATKWTWHCCIILFFFPLPCSAHTGGLSCPCHLTVRELQHRDHANTGCELTKPSFIEISIHLYLHISIIYILIIIILSLMNTRNPFIYVSVIFGMHKTYRMRIRNIKERNCNNNLLFLEAVFKFLSQKTFIAQDVLTVT